MSICNENFIIDNMANNAISFQKNRFAIDFKITLHWLNY